VYIPDDTVWNKDASETVGTVSCCGVPECPVLVAGEPLESFNSIPDRPFSGYKNPTAWIRRCPLFPLLYYSQA